MTDIAKRLSAALRADVVNGSPEERSIFVQQVREAVRWIERQTDEYGDFERHRCPRCDLVLWAENMKYSDDSPAPCPGCSNVRWAMVAAQTYNLSYGPFLLVQFDGNRWVAYRKGRCAFYDPPGSFGVKYFPSAAAALDACDALLAEEKAAEGEAC
jgi:hypothetical protein